MFGNSHIWPLLLWDKHFGKYDFELAMLLIRKRTFRLLAANNLFFAEPDPTKSISNANISAKSNQCRS